MMDPGGEFLFLIFSMLVPRHSKALFKGRVANPIAPPRPSVRDTHEHRQHPTCSHKISRPEKRLFRLKK